MLSRQPYSLAVNQTTCSTPRPQVRGAIVSSIIRRGLPYSISPADGMFTQTFNLGSRNPGTLANGVCRKDETTTMSISMLRSMDLLGLSRPQKDMPPRVSNRMRKPLDSPCPFQTGKDQHLGISIRTSRACWTVFGQDKAILLCREQGCHCPSVGTPVWLRVSYFRPVQPVSWHLRFAKIVRNPNSVKLNFVVFGV
ncbi:hypothetical protein BCR34DRAFT_316181 [Clohesyomyces aquaticus]|uniref:Uncharacterized protein n=1 Tax=Clohesyomyces aquaticus TaxID=1231657 RepID=A0A1Y1ZN55_9PLEO|nr:hypothetical protein BCR34DRAFT_316181 [Clohesyomyces aquaticus]